MIGFSQDTIHHIVDGCVFKDPGPIPENPPCDLGIYFEYKNDSLRIHGAIGANCCGDHLAILEKRSDTIFITTIDTGELCTCGCGYCFEIKIDAATDDTLVSINGTVYNTRDTLDSSIDELSHNRTFEYYPNPCSGILNIKSNGQMINSVEISDLFGRSIYQVKQMNKEDIQIDMSCYSTGVYIMRVNSFVYKFIKE
jgi:hypothetical protein